MITTHTDLLNALIEKHGLKSYLEIGVQNPANNFDKIKCENKTGVDPQMNGFYYGVVIQKTSDEFFKTIIIDASSKCGHYFIINKYFDLIFIDGDHTAEQVKRDFENSMRCLSENGFIVIHDVLPQNEEGTLIPRQTKKWWGTVYKFAMTLHHRYDNIDFITYNIDEGCCVIKKGVNTARRMILQTTPDWTDYLLMRKTLLNVTDEVTL